MRRVNALGIERLILTGDCADLWSPKTVRAGMGAQFRQCVLTMEREKASQYLKENDYKIYGAALSDKAIDIRSATLQKVAIVIGSEGRGLSEEMRELCDGEVIIPMNEECESLNAAVAAAIIMWELKR